MLSSHFFVSVCSVGLVLLGMGSASGQDYPNKPIRIVTSPAGGGSDFVARIIASGISGPLGQPLTIDNRPSGVIPIETVAKAPADGYTLLLYGASLWLIPFLQKAPYDVVRDFSPLSLITREVNVLVVHPSVPAKSVKELIALAKARPGQLNYGSAAIGASQHLGMELLKNMADLDVTHIPYKGGAASIAALISGEVQVSMNDAGVVAPHVKSGKLRALAVTTAQPSALAPGLPTVAASGVPGYELTGMTGVFAPAKTPAPIITRLNQEMIRLLRTAEVKERFLNAGVEPVGNSPEEFAAIIKTEIAKWGKLIKDAGIEVK